MPPVSATTTFLAAVLLLFPALAADKAPAGGQTAPVLDCAKLSQVDLTGLREAPTFIISSKAVAATERVAEHCAVQGYVQPQVEFEIRLPIKSWNGRYLQAGCGGFCGSVRADAGNDALAQGFVTSANNLGHTSGQEALWASDPLLRIDFGARSAHVVAVAAKAITERYYGKQPAFSYFRGCSTGGREGLQEALRYPADFDGIIAGDPAFPGRQGGISNNWIAHELNTRDGSETFPPETIAFLHKAALAKCDAIDGVSDGIIAEPRACDFKPSSVACAAGQSAGCLNPAQVKAAERLYGGARNSKGQLLYPGWVTIGSELSWTRTADANYATQYLRYMGFPEQKPASYTYWDFNFDTDMEQIKDTMKIYDPVAPGEDPDLSAFQKRGGRLMVYHGWADLSVSPITTVDFYAEAAKKHGGMDKLKDWYRVFMIPGMSHCRGGGVPDRFDMLTPITAWVEQGKAPDMVMSTQMDGQKVVRTRPLYPYPTVARYSGKGDVNEAANWGPAAPAQTFEDDIDWIWEAKAP